MSNCFFSLLYFFFHLFFSFLTFSILCFNLLFSSSKFSLILLFLKFSGWDIVFHELEIWYWSEDRVFGLSLEHEEISELRVLSLKSGWLGLKDVRALTATGLRALLRLLGVHFGLSFLEGIFMWLWKSSMFLCLSVILLSFILFSISFIFSFNSSISLFTRHIYSCIVKMSWYTKNKKYYLIILPSLWCWRINYLRFLFNIIKWFINWSTCSIWKYSKITNKFHCITIMLQPQIITLSFLYLNHDAYFS